MPDVTQILIDWKAAVVGLWFAGFVLIEWLAPAVKRLGGWSRLGRNGGLWLVNAIMSPLIILPLSAWAAAAAPAWRPAGWVGLGPLLIDLLILDMLIYGWHRANHVLPWLWRFHEIHHLDQFLDATSALRFHFGEVLLSAAFRVLVIIALDLPFISIVVFETVLLAAAIFHHSNLRLPRGFEQWLSWIIVTPAIHWVHHHDRRQDTDANYASVLSLWDAVFKSRSPTKRYPEMTIGVEGRRDESIAALLIRPFRRQA